MRRRPVTALFAQVSRPRRVSRAALVALATLAAAAGCSNQSEGGLCNQNSDDCSANLSCVPVTGYGFRCCPVAPAQPTTQICGAPNQTGIVDANVPPSEGGTSGDAEAGAPASDAASSDGSGGADAAHDAPLEAEASAVAQDASETGPGDGGNGADASDGATE